MAGENRNRWTVAGLGLSSNVAPRCCVPERIFHCGRCQRDSRGSNVVPHQIFNNYAVTSLNINKIRGCKAVAL